MDTFQNPSGKIISIPSGYRCFVPDPLPPKILWSLELVNALSQADTLLGQLARECKTLPLPKLLIRPFVYKEAVLSSRIEGTQASFSDVLLHKHKANPESSDLSEVLNYIKAFEYGIERLKTFPWSLRIIKELHQILMTGVRGEHAQPGEFRSSQNWIGSAGCTLRTAKYIPPDPHRLSDCLADFEKFLHNTTLPPLIHIACCHYQFEAIHPFLDGNGRVGRLLISLLLPLPSPLLYLSAFFEKNRDEYYRHLFHVSTKSAWNEWFEYFLNGVARSSQDALTCIEALYAELGKWKKRVKVNPSSPQEAILEGLLANPFVSATSMATEHKIAYTSAQRFCQKLIDEKILEPIDDKKRGKVFVARSILLLLDPDQS